MAYATYTTEAVVCGSRDSNTSDKSYLLFTESAGMLWATARSVREERSKQRQALQDFGFIRVSLVKGKSGWRTGSVEGLGNAFLAADTQAARVGVTQVVRLLRRLVHGEELQKAIYNDTKYILQTISQIEQDQVAVFVDGYTLRLMHNLGYVAKHPDYEVILSDDSWHKNLTSLPAAAHKAIHEGLEVSHL